MTPNGHTPRRTTPARLGVLASGKGSNLQAIMDACSDATLDAMVALVISDQPNAFALQRARNAGIPTRLIERGQYPTRVLFDQAISEALLEFRIDWIVLAGFMRLLGQPFVKRHRGKILNIHPSLLPAYPGLDAISRAYHAQETHMGVTVHFVDEGMDTGEVILQESFYREPTWTLEETESVVHRIEHRIYPLALASVMKAQRGGREKV